MKKLLYIITITVFYMIKTLPSDQNSFDIPKARNEISHINCRRTKHAQRVDPEVHLSHKEIDTQEHPQPKNPNEPYHASTVSHAYKKSCWQKLCCCCGDDVRPEPTDAEIAAFIEKQKQLEKK